MEDISMQDREGNLNSDGRVQFASAVLSQESRFMKAIFIAIAELAPNREMANTVVELAQCGRWVSESMSDNVDDWAAELSLSRGRLQ